uniref:Exocyst component Exo84 C-terminal domain-containing protein n=1 Tax=Plectus sambesii TaxID=2011161 RepID=A0A914V189_9BILA
MSANRLEEALSAENFDVPKYIKGSLEANTNKSHNEVQRLQELRGKMQGVANESSKAMKKNVFSNYKQFIETAKEITHLEGEMYQLSHLLSEQKTLIEQMMDMSFISGGGVNRTRSKPLSTAPVENKDKKSIQALLEKIEGISHLSDNSDRHVLFESDLFELHSETLQPLRNMHAILLNDGLMLTSWVAQRIGAPRYKFESLFQLENMAAVNVKDAGDATFAFKLLVFPEHKYFGCDSLRTKRQWLDSIEAAKRQMIQESSLVRQATIRNKRASISLVSPPQLSSNRPQKTTTLPDGQRNSGLENGSAESEWLRELPDELDVCIAQRDFESAVELLFEGRDHLAECGEGPTVRQVREKLAQKERQLVEVVGKELRNTGSLQGGPKAARKAITLLIRLGKSSQACDLYLKSRSAAMKQSIKEVRIAEDPLSYLRHLSRIVFGTLLDVAREFTKLFAGNPGCCSVLLFWGSGEIKTFVHLVLRHIFEPGPSLSVLGQCVSSIFDHCAELAELGLDLTFEVDKLMTPAVKKAIDVNCRNFIDATRARITEDKWKPYNLQSEANLNRFMEEMSDLGLRLDAFVCEDGEDRCRLWVTSSSCHFARIAIAVSKDVPAMRLADLRSKCDNYLLELWQLMFQHLTDGLAAASGQAKRVADRSVALIVGQLMPICEVGYVTSAGFEAGVWTPLTDLIAAKYPALMSYVTADRQFESIGDV